MKRRPFRTPKEPFRVPSRRIKSLKVIHNSWTESRHSPGYFAGIGLHIRGTDGETYRHAVAWPREEFMKKSPKFWTPHYTEQLTEWIRETMSFILPWPVYKKMRADIAWSCREVRRDTLKFP